MIGGKNILLYLNKVYKGNWDRIFQAIKSKEDHSEDNIKDIDKEINHPFVTLLDDSYPSRIRDTFKPPTCLFHCGDLELLNKDNLIAISRTNIKDISNKSLIEDIVNSYILVSGYDNRADEETLRIAMKHNKKFILVVDSSLDDIDYDDEIIDYAVHNDCLIISEFGFENDDLEYATKMKQRIIAPLLHGLLVASGEKSDLRITLLVDAVLEHNGNVFALPEPPFQNSLTNSLIKNGAYLVDSFLDMQDF